MISTPNYGLPAPEATDTFATGIQHVNTSIGIVDTQLKRVDNLAGAAGISADDRNRANHTGPQAQSTITNLVSDIAARALMLLAAGYQIWNGTAWSTRPVGFLYVEAFSDGTAGSVSSNTAPTPTGALNGDRWSKAV